MTLTARETEALGEIFRIGGGLPGGRENTQVTNRLLRKGMVRHNDILGVEVTHAGREALGVTMAQTQAV